MKYFTILLLGITIAFNSHAQIKVECLSGNCVNGKGIKKYADGSAYDGEFLDSLRNGFGVMVWQGGDKYIGDWKAGLITGKGTMIFTDGRRYEGNFFNNQFEGKGTMIYKDGSKYSGDWKADKCNGKGRLELKKNNCVYEGDFVSNLWEGKGTLEWVEGSEWKGNKYIGDFKKGQRFGKGKYIYANGDWYEGDFIDGLFSGEGTMSYKDGSKYIGAYKSGQRNGKGKYISVNGTMQEGDFENDKFLDPTKKEYGCVSGDCENGIGTFNYKSDIITYTGKFKNGISNGEGTYKNWDGIYKGQIFREERNGFGTFTTNNGYSYSGIWKYNKIENGTINDGKGTTYTGQLKEGRYDWVRNGEGTEISGPYMGRTTKGNWKDGKLTGKGVQIYPNGYYVKAIFNDNSSSNEEYFDNQNNKISYSEFKAKAQSQYCSKGDCMNGIGICEYEYNKTIFIGYFKNFKKDGFVVAFDRTGTYYYGIWKEDSLLTKIDTTEAKKYLSTNPKVFYQFLNVSKNGNDERNNSLAAAAALIENCKITNLCKSGNCKNGYGTQEDCDGNNYTGNFANGLFHGKGKLVFANGDVYDGYWVNNLMSGKGKYTWGYNNYYEGDWVKGIREGKGIYKFSDGEVYEGSFINNERHGKGKSVDKEGRIRDGNWVNNAFVITEEQRELNGLTNKLISALYESIEKARQTYHGLKRPTDPFWVIQYEKDRNFLIDEMNRMNQEITKLKIQIIE